MRLFCTPDEMGLLSLLQTGATDRAIGQELGHSRRQVQRMIHDLLGYLDAHSRRDLLPILGRLPLDKSQGRN
jgi:DNA-binding NarL/FixJ family response regulator